jgi:hypothetical protein
MTCQLLGLLWLESRGRRCHILISKLLSLSLLKHKALFDGILHITVAQNSSIFLVVNVCSSQSSKTVRRLTRGEAALLENIVPWSGLLLVVQGLSEGIKDRGHGGSFVEKVYLRLDRRCCNEVDVFVNTWLSELLRSLNWRSLLLWEGGTAASLSQLIV